jgi:hypothetical protein
MIAQGTDGLSRGITTSGVMEGKAFSLFVPLHLNARERQGPSLVKWVHSWLGNDAKWLTPEAWFSIGHTTKCGIWFPPPVAAAVALEQLGQAIHKCSFNTHVVIIPRLMTSRWRKLLGKNCDLVKDGITHNLNLLLLASLSLCAGMSLGASEALPSWNELRGLCVICRTLLLDWVGLFCANYSAKRGPWNPCQQAWCGPCYKAPDIKMCPIARLVDEDNMEIDDPVENRRYL